ncbi:homoserine dehydrogenase [Crocinitomix algicola]|uniref:homoserine dehydrogenase n=1 Tax=Crocinitomix algicola TaxID=1740263 RepID=UPI000872A532|nr:homoserine dehydrogenase [Crocinitomix algicola]
MSNNLKIGLFGFGCVGTGLYKVLNQSSLLSASIEKIVVKNKNKQRELSADNFSYDPNVILDDPEINLVVELIDDADAAFEIVKTAFRRGKNVVSANKKLIAEHLEELLKLSAEFNVSFLYEAAVCGSIPVIRNLEEYYNNDSLTAIEGICNGTSNYILTRISKELKSFDEILTDAQNAGFAESDPTLDIDGFDSKYKLQILLLHTFGILSQPKEVLNIGVRHVKQADVSFAKERGLRLRLLSYGRRVEDEVVAFVAPVFVDELSFSFDVNYEFNGVSFEALFSDKQVFTGKGAGSFPTASAVLSDVSALQYDYQYEYKKKNSTHLGLAKDFKVKVFVSANDQSRLALFSFLSIEEEYQSAGYAYKVGWINRSDISHELYRDNPDLFIAFYGNNPVELIGTK